MDPCSDQGCHLTTSSQTLHPSGNSYQRLTPNQDESDQEVVKDRGGSLSCCPPERRSRFTPTPNEPFRHSTKEVSDYCTKKVGHYFSLSAPRSGFGYSSHLRTTA